MSEMRIDIRNLNLKGFTTNKARKILLIVSLLLIIFFILRGSPVVSWGHADNYENVSVRTTVNVTNSYPEILNISCNNGTAITLNAGGIKTIDCLVEIRDYSGGNTINYVNGTFYFYLNESSDPDDNNTHYRNTSCTETNTNGYYTNWTCSYDLLYYALNGSWIANSTVNDSYGVMDNDYGNATINALLALNVTPVIDFDSLQVTETSGIVEANVTNYGNVPINVSLYGFGGNDSVAGAGLAMNCTVRNITLPNERYSLNSTDIYANMIQLTDGVPTPPHIPRLTVPRQENDSQQVINSSYWRLHVNLSTNPFGICNGTVVFAAESPYS